MYVILTHIPKGISELSIIDIANHIYQNPTALDLNLQGIWIADRKNPFLITGSLLRYIFLLQ
jgi:hypothetical protein